MKPRRFPLLVLGIAVIALACGLALMLARRAAEPAALRHVTMVVRGPAGQTFHGSYTADRSVTDFTAATPFRVEVTAREFTYSLTPDARAEAASPAGGGEEFRVEVLVDETMRTSRVSFQGQPVEGGYRLTADRETVW